MACIYQIRNLVNNKKYIGSTQKPNSFDRKTEHFCKLRGNYHNNRHLQKAWNKYGEKNFSYEIIEEFKFPKDYTKDYIYDYVMLREIFYINNLNPEYNIVKEVSGGKLDTKMSEENKKKMSTLHKGRKHSLETIDKIKTARAKQIITEEHKLKISKSLKGKTKGRKGHSPSEEQRKKTSQRVLKEIQFNIGFHSVKSKEKRTKTITELYNTPAMKEKFKILARNRNRKAFVAIKNNKTVGEFTNQAEAAEILGFSKPWGISAVLNGLQNTHKGYSFIYKNI